MSPFKIVRSASVDGANRSVTTYKVERSPTSECWDVALLEAISGKSNVKDTKISVDKTKNESDGVEAFREAIGKKDSSFYAHATRHDQG